MEFDLKNWVQKAIMDESILPLEKIEVGNIQDKVDLVNSIIQEISPIFPETQEIIEEFLIPYLIANEVNLFKKGIETDPVEDYGIPIKEHELFKQIVGLRSKL